jgi:trigger factor
MLHMPEETQNQPQDVQPPTDAPPQGAQSQSDALPQDQPVQGDALPVGEMNPPAESPTDQADDQTEQDDMADVQAVAEDAGTLKKKITVTVPRSRIDGKFNELYGELATTALVPGFRVGRAPRRLIEKRFGKDVTHDARNALIGQSLGAALKKVGLEKTIGEPAIDLDKITLPDTGDLSFSFEVEVPPDFELPALTGIKVNRPKLTVQDKHVDQYLEEIRSSRAHLEPTEESAAEGDIVLAGAKITIEGAEPIDRPGLTLRVAPGQIEGLPLIDMGKALAGKKSGESAGLTLKVPDAHANEAWRGKNATIEITVSQVRRRHLPELNEQFAAGMGFDSLDEMRKYVSVRLTARLEQETHQAMRDQICRYLLDSTKFDLPPGVATRHAATMLRRRYVDLLQRGVPREQIDENLAKLQAQAEEESKIALKLMFILDKAAETQKIEVTEGEVNARIAQMAASSNRRPERLRQELEADGSLEQVQLSVREDKALDRLLEQAEIVEETETETQTETQTETETKTPSTPTQPVETGNESAEAPK